MPHLSRLPRSVLLAVLAAAILASIVAAAMRSIAAPPRITRMLPEADAIVYASLKQVRLATHFDRSAPPRSPGLQRFVDATGIVPERDLDEAAFALTRRARPDGPNGPVAYTEIFRGHFDATRLAPYLAGEAVAQEQYAGRTIFSLPSGEPGSSEPRVLRVALLGQETIVVSNASTPEQTHAVIDRGRAGWFGGSVPSLLTNRFREVPTLSTAWAIGSLGLPLAESGHVSLLGVALPLPADQPMIASLRYGGVLRLRVAAIAPSPELAMQQSGALSGLLGLLRTLGQGQAGGGGAADAAEQRLRSTIQSITIKQAGNETVVTADLPIELLGRLTASP